ncbi:hypothetical protein ACHHYP_04777 [Achlya hypogyna]|uniref:Uncharacterized protein n=1 Tax=Achlya hypogyna TaxID=1202772 RepID=A0A1V9YZU2_ACHHY|nr:hypothetical protein ACHHYP_04777 [Achlya hypogyna]
MLSSGLSSLAASLASTANVAASTAQLHAVLQHSLHLPKSVSQLWQSVAALHEMQAIPAVLSKAPLDLTSALVNAVSRNSVANLRLLLDYGANVHAVNADGQSILFVAASLGHAAIVTELLARGARPEPAMMSEAIEKHHTDVVALLQPHIAVTGIHVHDAVATNAPAALIKMLLKAIDDSDVVVNDMTPLMLAAFKGHAALCDVLLDHNADVFAENEEGNTALHFACREGRVHATYVLLQAGADMDMPNVDDETPFDVAAPHLHPLLDCNGVIDEAIVLQWQRQLDTRGSILPASLLKKRAAKYADFELSPIAEEAM